MRSDRGAAPLAPWPLRIMAWSGIAFLHVPLVLVAIYAFNTEEAAFSFPPQGFTLRWFAAAAARDDVIAAIALSVKVALVATGGALLLGTLAALAMARRTFFGKDLITLAFILPIALPGIITGIALHSVFRLGSVTPGFWTQSTPETSYKPFIARVQEIVKARGKQMVGWGEIAKIEGLSPQSLVQHWTDDANLPRLAAKAGAKVIMSPATRVYFLVI